MILASCICQSRSFISASILSIEKVKGVLALIVEAMKGDVPAHFFFLFLFQVCLFLCLFSHGFETQSTRFPRPELFSVPTATEAWHCFVCHPEHPPAPGGGERRKGEQEQKSSAQGR